MQKRILTFFCILALLVSLAIPAFAGTVWVESGDIKHHGFLTSDLLTLHIAYYSGGASADSFIYFDNLPVDSSFVFGNFSQIEGAVSVNVYNLDNSQIKTFTSTDPGTSFTLNNVSYIKFHKTSSASAGAEFSFDVTYVPPPASVLPVFANPVQAGEYIVSGLHGTESVTRMYTTRDDPKVFTFTDVTANASTVVSYALEASGGVVTYHDIGTLTEDFTFKSSDYPVADFFTVRNNGSSTVSYTVNVTDDSFEKTQSMAQNIWETCLSMGTSMINWLKTPSNFIALIPLAMFVLVGAVLMIRKLIKGV